MPEPAFWETLAFREVPPPLFRRTAHTAMPTATTAAATQIIQTTGSTPVRELLPVGSCPSVPSEGIISPGSVISPGIQSPGARSPGTKSPGGTMSPGVTSPVTALSPGKPSPPGSSVCVSAPPVPGSPVPCGGFPALADSGICIIRITENKNIPFFILHMAIFISLSFQILTLPTRPGSTLPFHNVPTGSTPLQRPARPFGLSQHEGKHREVIIFTVHPLHHA